MIHVNFHKKYITFVSAFTCSTPTEKEYSSTNHSGLMFGSIRTYVCDLGYEWNNKTTINLQCNAQRKWENGEEDCQGLWEVIHVQLCQKLGLLNMFKLLCE